MNWLSSIIPCTAPIVTPLIILLSIILLVQVSFLSQYHPKRYSLILICQMAALILIVFWLGSYRFSPLYTNVNPLARGFDVTVGDKVKANIRSGEIITVGQASAAVIVPLTLPGDRVLCNWSSQMGSAFDDPNSCETIYSPPVADYDILRLSIRSSCGLANAVGQIKISVLP